MRLSTRVGIGMCLAIVPLLVLLFASIETTREVAAANERLTRQRLVGHELTSAIIARLDRIDEYEAKLRITGDADYAQQLASVSDAISADIRELSSVARHPQLEAEVGQLVSTWAAATAGEADFSSETLDELRRSTIAVQTTSRRVADEEVERSTALLERTNDLSMAIAGLAVSVSLIVVFFTLRSVRRRLDGFIVATEGVSRGSFATRVDDEARDELGRVARAFNRMTDELGELDRLKSDFVSSVSHELRTPLVALKETNAAMLDGVFGPLTASQTRMLRLNDQAATRLFNMISELLELSRVRAGMRYDFGSHDVVPLARDVVAAFRARSSDQGVALSLRLESPSVPAWCDPDRFVQVLQNLLDNALKHTTAGGRVRVTVSADDDGARLTVEDDGPGIPPADRDRVFERFFHRQGLASRDGVGLGLAICREIVTAHGGDIRAELAALGGAAIVVVWPQSEAQVGPVPRAEEAVA